MHCRSLSEPSATAVRTRWQNAVSYRKCQELFRCGLIDAIAVCDKELKSIVGDGGQGLFPINGIALDILPWFDQAGIAFRIQSDPPGFDLAEWEHYDHFFDLTMGVAGPLARPSAYAAAAYKNPPSGIEPGEMAHLIFLAGAEALLDQTVVGQFYETLGIADNASMFDTWFEYFVVHPDNVCRANYCDIVRANRITERVLSSWQ